MHLKNNDLFRSVIPSKIFESLAMGKPILHGVDGESKEIIIKNNVGLLHLKMSIISMKSYWNYIQMQIYMMNYRRIALKHQNSMIETD